MSATLCRLSDEDMYGGAGSWETCRQHGELEVDPNNCAQPMMAPHGPSTAQ